MDRLNFNHLFYFYLVAKEGSVKAASEKAFVSQPTISDQIKLLEEYLETKLFERRNRALFLTPTGEVCLTYAEKVFELSREMTTRLRNKEKLPKKTIDIGITHHMSHYFLYEKLLPLFKKSDASVRIKESERHLLLAELEEENVDIVFSDNKDSLGPSIDSYRIGLNQTFVVAHRKFIKSKKNFPKSLNDLPFFHYTQESFLKYEIDLFFRKHDLTPKIVGEADDIDLFQVVAAKGLAFTIVPEVAKNRLCMDKNIVVLGEIKELQTSVWALVKSSYKGFGLDLIDNHLRKG
jgi:LysR family transcriptional activator of nhaA